MVATALLAATDAVAGTTALVQGADAALGWGAVVLGAGALVGLPVAARRMLSATRATNRFPAYSIPAVCAVLAAVAGVVGLFSVAMPLLAWGALGISAVIIALGVICGLVDEYDVRLVLVVAAGLILLAAAIYALVALLVNDRGGWVGIPIAVIVLLVGSGAWITTQEFAVELRGLLARLRPQHDGAPGARIPAVIGLAGPASAVATSVFIATSGTTVQWGLPFSDWEDGLVFAAGTTAIQVAVQLLVIALLQPAIGLAWIRDTARITQQMAGEVEHEWAMRHGHPDTGRLPADSPWDRGRAEWRWRERDVTPARRDRRGLLVSPRAVASAHRAALTQGVVVDDLWPVLETVLPVNVRRKISRMEHGIALSRVVAASAVGATVLFLLAEMTDFVAIGGLVFLLAVFTGRRLVADAYTSRVNVSAVYRIELARTLGLRLPHTQAGLVAMGQQLSAGLLDERPAPVELHDPSSPERAVASQEVHVLRKEFDVVAAELRSALERMERKQADFLRGAPVPDFGAGELDRLAEQVAEHTAGPISSQVTRAFSELQSTMGKSMARLVDAAMAGPELVNFTGYLVIELAEDGDGDTTVKSTGSGIIATPPGGSVELNISVVADQFARDAAPDRQADSAFVALETVHIEDGRTETVVDFDLIIDSATMTPSPHRLPVQVTRLLGEQQKQTTLQTPDGEGVHEAWVQLFQAGRLVQAVVVAIDTRGRSDDG